MSAWLPAAILSLFSFGLWGLFTKLSVAHIDSKSALIYQTLGVLIIGLLTLGSINFKPSLDPKGCGYALLTGAAYGIGCLFYFFAASKGKITTVVTLTALYPLITILLSFLFLREAFTFKQCIGIALGLMSIFMMAT